jgi:hypothetical protein
MPHAGRRGVFAGTIQNIHLHWKRHELCKIRCTGIRPEIVPIVAEQLAVSTAAVFLWSWLKQRRIFWYHGLCIFNFHSFYFLSSVELYSAVAGYLVQRWGPDSLRFSSSRSKKAMLPIEGAHPFESH